MIIESVLLLLLLIIILLLYSLNKKEYFRVINLILKLPLASKYPIIGVAARLAFIKETDIFALLQNNLGTKRLVADLLAGEPTVLLAQPRDYEKIMNSNVHITKGLNYNSLKMWLNEGLLTSKGEKWRNRRKLLTPTFHFRILEDCLPVMHKHATELAKKLLLAGSNPISIQSYITKCTLDILCETAMGISLNEDNEDAKQYVNDIKRICELILRRELCVWLRSSFIFSISPTGRAFFKTRNRLHNFTDKVIKERKQIFLNKINQVKDELYIYLEKKRTPFLDCLLQVQYNQPGILNDFDIREEVDTFIFEGHDTTSAALLFGLNCLGQHKDIQEKVVRELQTIFGTSIRPPNLKDLQQMTYLECVIKEALRMYPSVPFISRQLTQDLHLEDDLIIPASTNVLLVPYLLHRDAQIYPEPEKFDPERFNPNNSKDRHPFAFIPFSAGPRNCIGQKFAMLELKTILSTILRSAELESFTKAEDMKLAPLLILRASLPILIGIKPRQLQSFMETD